MDLGFSQTGCCLCGYSSLLNARFELAVAPVLQLLESLVSRPRIFGYQAGSDRNSFLNVDSNDKLWLKGEARLKTI